MGAWSPSTARPFPSPSSSPSSSATGAAPSPAPTPIASRPRSKSAAGGTLFLDEVGELPLRRPRPSSCACSPGAHRVRRVGDTKDRPVDIRDHRSDQSRPWRSRSRRAPSARTCSIRIDVIRLEVPALRERDRRRFLAPRIIFSRPAGSAPTISPSRQTPTRRAAHSSSSALAHGLATFANSRTPPSAWSSWEPTLPSWSSAAAPKPQRRRDPGPAPPTNAMRLPPKTSSPSRRPCVEATRQAILVQALRATQGSRTRGRASCLG